MTQLDPLRKTIRASHEVSKPVLHSLFVSMPCFCWGTTIWSVPRGKEYEIGIHGLMHDMFMESDQKGSLFLVATRLRVCQVNAHEDTFRTEPLVHEIATLRLRPDFLESTNEMHMLHRSKKMNRLSACPWGGRWSWRPR